MRPWKGVALASLIVVMGVADAQRQSLAENGLGGFRLFDTGMKILNVFGNPDDIQAIGVGSGSGGSGGGPASPPAGGGGGAPSGGGGGAPAGRRGGADTDLGFNNDFSWGQANLNIQPPGSQQGPSGGLPPGANPGPGAPGGGGGGNAPQLGAPATSAPRQSYTRWVYKRPGLKYGFVLDRFDRLVQIDAIALKSSKVVTRNGITFGATFKDVIKRYGSPEVLEVGPNQLVMRYLVRNKVAFRLNRLGQDKPHQVTAIMVAAGKY